MLGIVLGLVGCLGVPADQNRSNRDTIIVSIDTSRVRTLHVSRVIIIGNKVTRDRIISRELSLKPGDTLTSNRLNSILLRDKNKIYNLRLFNTVMVRALGISDDAFDILVEVTERWYTFPSPIFELSDRNFNEWWQNYHHDLSRVNYGLRLYQYNFRGRNETLRLTAQFGFTRKFELSYQIPYIDRRQKRGLVFNFDYGEPKNLAYYTDDHKLVYAESSYTLRRTYGAGITYNYRKNFYETHSLTLGFRTATVADTITYLTSETKVDYYKNGSTHQQSFGIAYAFNSDHRDVILYPLKGFQYTALLSYNGIGSTTVNLLEMNLTMARHWDLHRSFYLSNFTSVYLSTPSSQPYALYSALGYRKQLVRGYEIYVIEGPKFFLNKTTLKRRIYSHTWRWEDVPLEQFRHIPLAIYLKTYADWGYVQNYPLYEQLNINKRLSDRLLVGAGAGADIVTLYDLVFRLEYTFTREGTHGFFFNVKKEF